MLDIAHQPNSHAGSWRDIRSFRKLLDVVNQQHSNVSILVLITHLLLELLCVTIYVWTSFASTATSLLEFKWGSTCFIIEVAINVVFFLEWVVLFLGHDDKKRYCLSCLSLVNAMTSGPMIAIGVGAAFNSAWQTIWVPMFLRVWWLRECVVVLLDYPQVACCMLNIRREIFRFFATLFAVLCSCAGIEQITESAGGKYIDFFESLYCMVVTFGTIGYGDVVPRTPLGRIFMMGFLVVAVSYFLPLFQRLAQISMEHLHYNVYRSCRGKRPHVIFSGVFSELGADIILRNFYAGWRKYIDLRVVLLSPVEHPPEVKLLANSPWLRDRVVLMIGDPADRADLERADARYAEAIFLFGDTASTTYHTDYQVIRQSLIIHQYDRELPQHLHLRSERHTRHVAHYAASVVEVERLLHHLLGLGVAVPGAVPFVINLLRTYEPLVLNTTLSQKWIEEYEWSLQNDIYCLGMRDAFRGCSFHDLAKLFFNHNVTLMGIVSDQGKVQLNPSQVVSTATKLIVIARTVNTARSAVGRVEAACGDPIDGDVCSKKVRPETKAHARTRRVERDRPSHETAGSTRLQPDVGVVSLQRVDDAYDCESHFVIIDLSMAKAKISETDGAREGSLSSAAADVFHVMRSIRQSYSRNDIVLLTKDTSFSVYFERYWNSVPGAVPVKYVDGCGLNNNDLRRCNLKHCAGIIVFFSGDISGASSSGLSMLVVLSVASILQASHNIPVVVEMDSMQFLSLFPPYAEDPHLCQRAESDFVFEPNYIIGNAISRHMFFPSVHRTYFMDEFVDIIDMMVSGVDEETPSLGRLPLSLSTEQLVTYGDVINYCLGLCYLPVALHRCISDASNPSLDGQRFVLTNPPKNLHVNQMADAVFYLLPT
ncbi:putative Ion channel Calcium activated BK potassium channel alpha subunit [Trypanosoma vivax]|uniref:Calcium/potassium channel (CAKC), putative n=1 Tax=Trypanosoma vivax (strain Y486) TaxID=1055687 RepID=F9WRY9_TRYVY|nr:putative calcium/potassium channel (CAKC) [Trypanosoma vivax]KAH8618765.1 putative Ion channel Calcium activated BK potassium channel alpha subunit [Trypanosoma vivax]CCD20325.1 calcium/potassium channel (CAKC), putative [Trypanosoma vivax Y486]|eukprot:CCD20325.1 calcium/potassium channel (CAKC), putative [Trypanosoma vivax Y486]